MLLSHFNRELDKTAIIFEFLGKSFRNLEKLFLDRIFPLTKGKECVARFSRCSWERTRDESLRVSAWEANVVHL